MNAFADKYLKKQSLFSKFITDSVNQNLGIIVTIPCCDEPNLIACLNSLWRCERTENLVEVIVLINSGEQSSKEVLEQNYKSFKEAKIWIQTHQDDKLKFYIIRKEHLPKKFAGVGLARKIAMDEALSRFNEINKENGMIVGFDADSTCDSNYLVEMERFFQKNPKINGANLFFEHPLDGKEFDKQIYDGIAQYELYLRYYKLAMGYAGHPYAYHTIGSSFAVSARAYSKQGGMNRRQAGEDFYFLQKIIPLGRFYEINTTRVIPSPRISHRVPFGTGKAMAVFVENQIVDYQAYNYLAFKALKIFFGKLDACFHQKNRSLLFDLLQEVPEMLHCFLEHDHFFEALDEVNQNSASLHSFRKRFFEYFNAFKVLKYLNFVHAKFVEKESILFCTKQLFFDLKIQFPNSQSAKDLLLLCRRYEKTGIL